MILILDTEIQPDYRYLGPEIHYHVPGPAEYRVFVDDPSIPDLDTYDGVILSGSTASVYNAEEHNTWLEPEFDLIKQCIDERVPLLGVCFGHQAVNVALNGEVTHDRRRATFVELEQTADSEVLSGVNNVVPVLHADIVTELGDGMEETARTDYNDNFCSRHTDAPVWTVQFHPEFTDRVADEPTDWSPGVHALTECNTTRVFDNFNRLATAHEWRTGFDRTPSVVLLPYVATGYSSYSFSHGGPAAASIRHSFRSMIPLAFVCDDSSSSRLT